MTKARQFLLALALPLALCACSGSGSDAAAGDPPLEGAALGGPFELVDSKGETVRWSDFDGKYRMIYFGYAYCPDVCPFDLQRMAQGYNRFKEAEPALAAEVVPLFVTIDPERDTPEVVGEFTSAFSDDIVGLTGTPEQIADVARLFAVYYQKGTANAEGGYLVDHSRSAFLMGRKGEPVALLPVDIEDRGESVAEVLDTWVN